MTSVRAPGNISCVRTAATIAATVALTVSLPMLATSPAAATAGTFTARTFPAGAAAQVDALSPQLTLPRPSGPYAVGRDTLHLVDNTRPDPWAPESGARELMVSMYYPAKVGAGRPAPYLTTTEARLWVGDSVLAQRVSGTRSSARTKARPRHGRHPLVVLSPGFGLHRYTLTHLAEELASRGYIVASVDHAYESVGTVFPGGRVLTCLACEVVQELEVELARVAAGRAQDVTFLLDQLTGHRPAWHHADLIDTTRIGMAGHSVGGNASAAAMVADPRVLAGVNMDGSFLSALPDSGLAGRPFLLLGSEEAHRIIGWESEWPKLDGWRRWLVVEGTAHLDFSDIPVLAEQLGLPDGWPLPGSRMAQIMREYVSAFFDLHLRGRPQPLLESPTAGNPEVRFHQP